MPNALARCTTRAPMLPVPTTPSVFPSSSRPAENFFFSHFPAQVLCEASATRRASASSSATVCSATETLLPPGAFITTTPRRVAASRSMLSTPVPARPELDPGAEIVQATLDRPDHHQHVEIVEVAEMGDAEDLPLRRVLTADQFDPVLLEQVLDQLLGIDPVRREHGGHRRRGALRVQRETQRLHPCARCPGHALMAAADGFPPLPPGPGVGTGPASPPRHGGGPGGVVLSLGVGPAPS